MDDFIAAQTRKLEWLKLLAGDTPVIIAGDVMDKWLVSPEVINYAIRLLPKNTYAVAGQHELPNHRLSAIEKSGTMTLHLAGALQLLSPTEPLRLPGALVWGYSWGEKLPSVPLAGKSQQARQVAVSHQMCWHRKKPYPGITNRSSAIRLAHRCSGFDLIVTGDNHQTFTASLQDGPTVLNPGSFMRTSKNQNKHRPCIFFWEAHTNSTQRYHIPIDEDVIDTTPGKKAVVTYEDRMLTLMARLKGGSAQGEAFSFLSEVNDRAKQHGSSRVAKSVQETYNDAKDRCETD